MNKLCLDKTAIQNIHFEYGLVLQSKCQEIKKKRDVIQMAYIFSSFFPSRPVAVLGKNYLIYSKLVGCKYFKG